MRVRFAPSPTGYLHIGNARTALINHLIAKKNNWDYTLRIEDTDFERSSKESEESIIKDLKWLGIQWNEGPDLGGERGPYRQSERFEIYREYSEKLINENKAYYCYCTPEEVDKVRAEIENENQPFVCPNRCGEIDDAKKRSFEDEGRKPVIRFRVPEGVPVTVKDHIKGNIQFKSENIGGDFIIVRSDGTPVYNYIVVIDDALMGVTHVIRGEDHLSNTPKQILMADALGLPVPQYAHHALVLGEDRSKLSKRHGITSVELYRKEGYLPEALVNYLAMLGWATESGEEILSQDEIISQIDITSIAKSAAVFDFRKLRWMNGVYIRNYPEERIPELFFPFIEEAGYDPGDMESDLLEKVLQLMKGYCEVLSDIGKFLPMFFEDVSIPDEDAESMLKEEYSADVIKAAKELLESDINEENFITDTVNRVKEASGQKGKKLFMPVRAMLTGRLRGPELDLVLPLIGFEKYRKRIEYCFDKYCK